LRGQLVPQDIEVLSSSMDGDQVVPPVTTAASGTAASTVLHGKRELVVWRSETLPP